MKTYRILYRMAPNQGPPKLLLLTAPTLRAARDRAEAKLRLRYPHYVITHAEEASIELEELYREVEARRCTR